MRARPAETGRADIGNSALAAIHHNGNEAAASAFSKVTTPFVNGTNGRGDFGLHSGASESTVCILPGRFPAGTM